MHLVGFDSFVGKMSSALKCFFLIEMLDFGCFVDSKMIIYFNDLLDIQFSLSMSKFDFFLNTGSVIC